MTLAYGESTCSSRRSTRGEIKAVLFSFGGTAAALHPSGALLLERHLHGAGGPVARVVAHRDAHVALDRLLLLDQRLAFGVERHFERQRGPRGEAERAR